MLLGRQRPNQPYHIYFTTAILYGMSASLPLPHYARETRFLSQQKLPPADVKILRSTDNITNAHSDFS